MRRSLVPAALLLSTTTACLPAGPVTARAAGPAAPVASCVPNPANEGDGIALIDAHLTSLPSGVQASCEYKKTRGGPLPARPFSFRIVCPAGRRLAQPGFLLPESPSDRQQRVTGLLSGTDSSGNDFADVVLVTDTPQTTLRVNLYVLCR